MRPVIPSGPRQPQQPNRPFDPKDPSTWPKLSTRQYAERAAAAGYSPLTGKTTGTPVQPDTNMYNAGTMDVLRGAGNALIKAGDFVFKEPAKSAMRTLSTQNLQTALNPRSTATQRINAIGEDVMNVASVLPAVRAGLNYTDNALQNLALRKSIRNAGTPNMVAKISGPPKPDWSSLTPDEMGFATILNRNTPAEEVKRLYIQHNLEMEKSLNQGMRDIAEAMAERSGMDITRAYDFAEDYQKWQRRGGRNPGSN